ncbi:hypothetical protein QQ045_025595 [Rhodiola kirilowii]
MNIRSQDCCAIIQRLTAKLDSWNNHFFSRAGRRALIQSILQSIIFYWAQICFLPRKVIRAINSICARFMWNGSAVGRGCHLISWDKAVEIKEKGGWVLKD